MRVRRLPCLDEYFDGAESAVMIGDKVIVLSALATEMLALIGEGEVAAATLARHLTDRYGPPPGDFDGRIATEKTLCDMEKYGLVHLFPDIS